MLIYHAQNRIVTKKSPEKMSRFVILTHNHPFLHWDLMLEDAGVLRTWRLLSSPDSAGSITGEKITAHQLPDHRLFYLDYEGPISNNRGIVKRFDAGEYRYLKKNERLLILSFDGGCLRGEYLIKLEDETAEADSHWSFSFSGCESHSKESTS